MYISTLTTISFRPFEYKTYCTLKDASDLIIFLCIAVLEVGDGVFEVLSTSGDTHLGGDDFDKVTIVLL